jgi:hypothetical protein
MSITDLFHQEDDKAFDSWHSSIESLKFQFRMPLLGVDFEEQIDSRSDWTLSLSGLRSGFAPTGKCSNARCAGSYRFNRDVDLPP